VQLGVLLSPGFLEAEAALALEVARLLKWEAFTLARGRTALEGAGGSVWTPRYVLGARTALEVLVIPGGPHMSKLGRDPDHQDWFAQVWGALRAVFAGSNAALMLLELGQLRRSEPLAAHPLALEALRERGFRPEARPWLWQGKVCTTRGYLELPKAMLEWAGFSEEAKAHLGLSS
jgi:putative intracellular protease/amidase